MYKYLWLAVALVVTSCGGSKQQDDPHGVVVSEKNSAATVPDAKFELASPNGDVALSIYEDSALGSKLSVSFKGQPILSPSRLGLLPTENDMNSYMITSTEERLVNTRWTQAWGQSSEVRDNYHTLTVSVHDTQTERLVNRIEFRAYDDGVAFRYIIDSGKFRNAKSYTEHTAFEFSKDYAVRSYLAEQTPAKHSSLNQENTTLDTPILLLAESSPVVAIQEGALIDNGIMSVSTDSDSKNTLRLEAPPVASNGLLHTTSWRVLQLADEVGDLLLSNILVNLSPPTQMQDTSWIKTGKSLWDWRVRGATYGDHEYALDNASLQRMIDFAASHNMQYVMIDANWYGAEHEATSDPFTPEPKLDIKGLIKSSQSKGVGFILYLNDKASIHNDLDKLFEEYSSWGAAGIKYGFLEETGKAKVEKTLKIVRLAAKHNLLINFHDGPIAPTGLRRMYPNWLTREFVHAQTDAGRNFTPTGFLEMVNLNMLAGPMDMSNGFLQLDGLPASRNYVREEIYSTVAGEVARTLIVFSGLIILPDAPEEYARKEDLFTFLRQMPATWDESKVLVNDLDKVMVMARRSGSDWFLGAAVNEEGGTVSLPLDFLSPGTTYELTAYADTDETHYKTKRESYQITTKTVSQGETIEIKMAPGGGQAITLRPITKQ